MAGNQAPCQQGPGQRKAVTSRPTANHTAEGDKCPGGRQGGERQGSPASKCNFLLIIPSLQ